MLIHFNSYRNITFPVYRLPNDNWDYIDGLLFLDNKVLDDRNMPGKTLGVRRIQSPQKNHFPLKIMLTNFVQVIKYGQGNYIDSNGRIFFYEKSKFLPLIYNRINRVEKKTTASLLWVKDINFPFTIPQPPEELTTYAGVLYYKNLPWLLYDYSITKLKPKRKKV